VKKPERLADVWESSSEARNVVAIFSVLVI
jgi:hypothetical protein